jgi:uncharacterized protein
MKYLLLIAIVLAVIWFARGARRLGRTGGAPDRAQGGGAVEEMVRCAHCGTHVPRRDAVLDARGLPYCGQAHRDAGPARS